MSQPATETSRVPAEGGGGNKKGKGKAPAGPKEEKGKSPGATTSQAQGRASYSAETVIVVSEIGGPYIGGKKLGLVDIASDVKVTLTVSVRNDMNAWQGFMLDFPLGADNEDIGFGVRHQPVVANMEKGRVELATFHRIKVSYPSEARLV